MDNQVITKTEYNQALDRLYELELQPLGFKKNGIHYYLVKGDLVFHIQNGWKHRPLTYLAFSKTWMSFQKDEHGKLSVPKYINRFPFSISVEMLRRQLKKYDDIYDFDYHTNFYDRINTKISNKDFFLKTQYQRLSLAYAFYVIDVIKNEGMRLADQLTTRHLYWSLIKYEAYHSTLYNAFFLERMNQMKEDLRGKLLEEGTELPSRKIAAWDDFWLQRAVRKGGS